MAPHGQRQAAYRTRAHPRDQRYDSALSHHEGLLRFHAKPDGTHTVCRWNWKWKSCLVSMAKNRSNNTAWPLLLKNARKACGNIKACGKTFPGAVGFWADMDNPYVTYHNDFIESEWWALKTIWEKGLLYKGFKSSLIAPAAVPPSPPTRWHRDIKRQGAFCCRPFPCQRRGRLYPGMDNHAVDAAFQCRFVCTSHGNVLQGKSRRWKGRIIWHRHSWIVCWAN